MPHSASPAFSRHCQSAWKLIRSQTVNVFPADISVNARSVISKHHKSDGSFWIFSPLWGLRTRSSTGKRRPVHRKIIAFLFTLATVGCLETNSIKLFLLKSYHPRHLILVVHSTHSYLGLCKGGCKCAITFYELNNGALATLLVVLVWWGSSQDQCVRNKQFHSQNFWNVTKTDTSDKIQWQHSFVYWILSVLAVAGNSQVVTYATCFEGRRFEHCHNFFFLPWAFYRLFNPGYGTACFSFNPQVTFEWNLSSNAVLSLASHFD